MLPALARRLPRGAVFAATRRGSAARAAEGGGADPGDWNRRLTALELRGLLYGPLGYLRSRRQEQLLRHAEPSPP